MGAKQIKPLQEKNDIVENAQKRKEEGISKSISHDGLGGHDPGIVDGHLEDSAEILRVKLENAKTLMSISRLKLLNYLTTLRKHIPGNSTNEIHRAMDGIEELCSLLKTESNPQYKALQPINERATSKSQVKKLIKTTATLPLVQPLERENYQKSHTEHTTSQRSSDLIESISKKTPQTLRSSIRIAKKEVAAATELENKASTEPCGERAVKRKRITSNSKGVYKKNHRDNVNATDDSISDFECNSSDSLKSMTSQYQSTPFRERTNYLAK